MNDSIIPFCHACGQKIEEENYYTDYLCNNCYNKIISYKYYIHICPIHYIPQGFTLITEPTKIKQRTQYILDKFCLYEKK